MMMMILLIFIEFYVGGSKELSVLFYAMQEHLEASVLYGPPTMAIQNTWRQVFCLGPHEGHTEHLEPNVLHSFLMWVSYYLKKSIK